MSSVKHISLDFWNTLGTANPEYSEERRFILSDFTSMIRETLDSDGSFDGHSVRYCAQAYKEVKKMIDADVLLGKRYSIDKCFDTLIDWLEVHPLHHELTKLKADLWEAFYKHPPTILHETIEQLQRLKVKGYTLSIGSNTNFIPGKVIREAVLDRLDLFDFFIFSDEIGVAKPNTEFFLRVNKATFKLRAIVGQSVLHIGDSKDFDYKPAKAFGLQAAHIDSPKDLPSILEKY